MLPECQNRVTPAKLAIAQTAVAGQIRSPEEHLEETPVVTG